MERSRKRKRGREGARKRFIKVKKQDGERGN